MAPGRFRSALIGALTLGFATCMEAFSGSVIASEPTQPFKDLTGTAIRGARAEKGYYQLRELFLTRLDSTGIHGVPLLTRKLLADPLDLEKHLDLPETEDFSDPSVLLGAQLESFLRELGVAKGECELISVPRGLSVVEDPPQLLQAMFTAATTQISFAFRAVAETERSGFLDFLDGILGDTAIDTDDGGAATEFSGFLARFVDQVDFAALDCATRQLAGMANLSILDVVRGWAETARPIPRPAWLDPRITGDLLWAVSTVHGVFLIGGVGPNIYGAPAAAVIDLGGDDLYLAQGNPDLHNASESARVVIDLAGDDRYLHSGDIAAGGAVMGVAFLYDAEGDDTYLSRRIGQGAGILGHGVLVDVSGNDLYSIDSFGQGAALAGIGLAWDGSGEDRWSAALLAQGSGGPLGMGVLIDRTGNDVFRTGDRYPSSYGTPGVFQSLAQGSGWGIRPALAGGIGLLQDREGNDTYLAGNFSQGAGYLGGTGVLRDLQGNDRFVGTRYSQGAAAHLAAGILVDEAGNDSFHGHVAANQGVGWDLALGVLFDGQGDDEYAGADLAQGSAAQNGIGLFVDVAGTDSLRITGAGHGHSGLLSYGEGRGAGNLAIFVNRQGDSRQMVVNGKLVK